MEKNCTDDMGNNLGSGRRMTGGQESLKGRGDAYSEKDAVSFSARMYGIGVCVDREKGSGTGAGRKQSLFL